MRKKDNPEDAFLQPENIGLAKRNPEGLMGVKAAMPGGSAAAQGKVSGEDFLATGVESVISMSPEEKNLRTPAVAGSGPGSPGGVPPVWGGREEGEDGWQAMLVFQGRGWEFFKLVFVNLLLSLVTLGVYSFWGKTKVRQYLWSRSELMGQPLEYTGTGKELFISFLIVMPILIVAMLLYELLMAFLVQYPVLLILGFVAFYAALLFLWLFASYRALRYRLTRTRWKGIRGNLSGSAAAYAVKGMGYLFLTMITLGLASPWMTARLANMQLNHVWFGNRRLRFDGPAKELVKSFFVMAGGMLGVFVVCGLIGYSAWLDLMLARATDGASGQGTFIAKIWLVYAILFLGLLLCSACYHATLYRWIFEHMEFGKLKLRSRITGMQVLMLRLTNALLVFSTLGVGFAWAEMRSMRLHLHSVDHKGDPELESLMQDTQAAPSRGEGLLDALDMDIGF